jgi:hypothetical protein
VNRLWVIEIAATAKTPKRSFFTEAETDAAAKELVRINHPFPKGAKIEVREIERKN